MTEIEKLRSEVRELRDEIESQRRIFRFALKEHERRLFLISVFLDWFRNRPWKPFSTDFSVWSDEEAERLKAEEQRDAAANEHG